MDTIEIEGLKERQEQFKRIMTSSPGMDKRLRAAIRKILVAVRRELASNARSGLGMDSDPRQAYKAVRHMVYKRIFGGNVSILQKRSAGSPGSYEPPRKGLPKKGGNRWLRNSRTIQVMGYTGADRGFVLRFLNAGTKKRGIFQYKAPDGEIRNIKVGGYRGSISARNWFGGASLRTMELAAGEIDVIIQQILDDEFK